MDYKNYNDEREIDLIDTLGYIVAKWRTICIVTLIGLILGVGVSSSIGFINMKNSDVEAQRMSAQKAEALALEKLLKDEKGEELQENADKNLIKYVNIQSLYNMQEEYNENSIYKNLDATHISKAVLTYYVDNHYVNEYPVVDAYNNINDVIGAYKTVLLSDEICNDIISAIGIYTEPKYIREIVTVETLSTSNLVITVLTDNEDVSSIIAEHYKNVVPGVTDSIIENYGDVTITLQEEQLYTESDIDVKEKQNDADSKILDYYTQLQTIEKSMSGAQGDYFEAILAKYNLETVETGVKHGFFYYVSKKLILLITIAAAFIAIAVYCAIYLFDGKIKTSDELAFMSCSTLLGTVLVDNKNTKKKVLFDKWAVALTDARAMCDDSDSMVKTITASIDQYLGSNELKTVLFVGTDIEHMGIVDTIRDNVTAAGYKVNVAVDAFDSADSVNKINESDTVVLIGEIGKSKYKKLERVLSLCCLYKKSVMGTVGIRERV